MDLKPMPIRPSGRKLELCKLAEYWFAAPNVWPVACGEIVSAFQN